MTAARIRLIVAGALLCAWYVWLGYLGLPLFFSRPIILSQPQLMTADVWVIADVPGDDYEPEKKVRIEEVVWFQGKKPKLAKGDAIEVNSLPKCRAEQHWRGPDLYILPLTLLANGSYDVTRIPESPGFSPDPFSLENLKIYPKNGGTLKQINAYKIAWKF